ncbi:MAG: DUF2818 family protein [Giesbergeria sp.]|nr:DUF2818 family protein [Giesbergeria sp.]
MSSTGAVWLVIGLACIAANLPFLNHRVLALGPALQPRKALIVHIAEMLVLYFVVGGIGLLLEKRAGQIAPQGWEFYAVTGTLFITLAFPGFIYRYLVRRRD